MHIFKCTHCNVTHSLQIRLGAILSAFAEREEKQVWEACNWHHLNKNGQLRHRSEPVNKFPSQAGVHFIGKDSGNARLGFLVLVHFIRLPFQWQQILQGQTLRQSEAASDLQPDLTHDSCEQGVGVYLGISLI